MTQLSVLVPARNEQWLARTVQDLLEHIEGDTDIIVVLDGTPANPPVPVDPRVRVVELDSSVGQRAATNIGARLSNAEYLMKVDAHCAFDPGFDVKLLAAMQDDITMVPIMRNLWVFDWVCPHNHRRYQSPSGPCSYCTDPRHDEKQQPRNACKNQTHTKCDTPTTMEVVWNPKPSPQSKAYCFDSEPHFQYMREFSKRPEGKPTDANNFLTETMSLQGSCFLISRERYHALDICDEAFGTWGSQGIEVAAKTWLSGGRVICNQRTWYAHCFRTQGSDFSFPYPLSGRQVDHAKKYARELFFENKWPLQVRPLSWLLERFWPVPGWSEAQLAEAQQAGKVWAGHTTVKAEARVLPIWFQANGCPGEGPPSPSHEPVSENPTLGILYYTDNCLNIRMAKTCRQYIAAAGLPITSVTLKPTAFGRNIVVHAERSYKTMFLQIETGLANMTEDFVFFVEHDVLYHKSHFDFIPPRRDCWYYNGNWWVVRLKDGFAVSYDLSPLAGLVVDRQIALTHFRERNAMIKAKGFGYWMGFEPMTHHRVKWENWWDFEVYQATFPNIDIAHTANLTQKRFTQTRFIRKPKNWQESDAAHIPGWPDLPRIVKHFGETAGRRADISTETCYNG